MPQYQLRTAFRQLVRALTAKVFCLAQNTDPTKPRHTRRFLELCTDNVLAFLDRTTFSRWANHAGNWKSSRNRSGTAITLVLRKELQREKLLPGSVSMYWCQRGEGLGGERTNSTEKPFREKKTWRVRARRQTEIPIMSQTFYPLS
jgi:hypothetical protein